MDVLYEILGSNSRRASSVNVDDMFPRNKYRLKVNKRDTRKRCEIWSELTIKTPERRQ